MSFKSSSFYCRIKISDKSQNHNTGRSSLKSHRYSLLSNFLDVPVLLVGQKPFTDRYGHSSYIGELWAPGDKSSGKTVEGEMGKP